MAIPIGLQLPIRNSSIGMFEQTFDTDSAALANLSTLLRTRKGEIPMMPDFGTDLYSVLFEQSVDDIELIIKDTITDEVAYWLPSITIKDAVIDRNDTNIDMNRIAISVTFSATAVSQDQTLTFTI